MYRYKRGIINADNRRVSCIHLLCTARYFELSIPIDFLVVLFPQDTAYIHSITPNLNASAIVVSRAFFTLHRHNP